MTEYLLPLKNVITNLPLFVVLNIFFIIATYTDIRWMKIYNKFNIVMLLTRVATFFIFDNFSFSYLIGGALIFIILLVGAIKTEARIGGDIKFGGNIGLWMGFMPSCLVILTALIINFIFRKITKNVKAIALAPFLYAGFIIVSLITYFVF